jgi:hypothetical protein
MITTYDLVLTMNLSFRLTVFQVLFSRIAYLGLNIAEPKWPGGPCRPAGEKTPPTATLLI